ncbi:MAG: hypothetical protein D6814_00515 [Calditrichaeota bacterium]|nr:MAG: hypothetical protein D6814_00515 [Calditrichota bacterium]
MRYQPHKIWYPALFLSWVGVHLGCSGPAQMTRPPGSVLSGLQNVASFAMLFKKVSLQALEPFDMLILEPDEYTRRDLRELTARGKIVLAYLNIGEIEAYRPYAAEVRPEWLLSPNPNWAGHIFVDPAQRGWWHLLQRRAIEPILEMGFQGLFLDSVDLAANGRFPETRPAMVKFIRWLHQKNPSSILLLNNGLFLLDDVAHSVHGVVLEEAFSVADEQGNYRIRSSAEQRSILQEISQARERWRCPLFLVEYCPGAKSPGCARLGRLCRQTGLPYFLTDVHATRLYPHIY